MGKAIIVVCVFSLLWLAPHDAFAETNLVRPATPGHSTHGRQATSPFPLAQPNLDFHASGTVENMVRQPDGGMIVFGAFDVLDGGFSRNLVRIKPDGTVDPNWHAYVQGAYGIHMAVDPVSGDIYVSGNSPTWMIINDTEVHLARLSAKSGAIDNTWTPQASRAGTAGGIAVDAKGNVYVDGGGGSLVRLSGVDGSVEKAWSGLNSVYEIAMDADSSMYVLDYEPLDDDTPNWALLKIDGATDEFVPNWRATLDSDVFDLLADRCGHVYAAGHFSKASAVQHPYLARFSAATGALDTAWNPAPDKAVLALAADADCTLYAGGSFSRIGGQPRASIAKLSGSSAQTLADWNPGSDGVVQTLLLDANGTLRAGGYFNVFASQSRLGYASVDSRTAQPGPARDFETAAAVSLIAPLSDGSIVVGGNFGRIGTLSRPGLAHVLVNGDIDQGWRSEGPAWPQLVAIGRHDEIYVANTTSLQRLDTNTGSRDLTFDVRVSGQINSVDVSASGDVYVGGKFSSINGVPRSNLARLSAVGIVDPAFDIPVSAPINELRLDQEDALYIGGSFSRVNNESHPSIAKIVDGRVIANWGAGQYAILTMALDPLGDLYVLGSAGLEKLSAATGLQMAGWSASGGQYVSGMEVDGAGHLYMSGTRTGTNYGAPYENYWRYQTASGALDGAWSIRTANRNGDVFQNALAVGADGRIFVGGSFTDINGRPRTALAAFSGQSATLDGNAKAAPASKPPSRMSR